MEDFRVDLIRNQPSVAIGKYIHDQEYRIMIKPRMSNYEFQSKIRYVINQV